MLRLTLCVLFIASVATLDVPFFPGAAIPNPFSRQASPADIQLPSRAGSGGLLAEFSQRISQKGVNGPNPLEKVGRQLTVANAALTQAVKSLDLDKYPKLFFAGGFCAAITHVVTVPIDVVKTKMQVNPGEFKNLNDGISKIYNAEGPRGLMQGMAPTFCGFILQGALKYGFYEFFKDTLASLTPPEQRREGGKLPVPQMMLAASAAEILGTTALLPFESARIRMVADPTFAKGMFATLGKLVQEQGLKGIYGGLIPIWCKQVPFTITQFLVFEFAASTIYRELAKRNVDDASAKFGTAITLGCGLISGVTASLVSQPGDTVLSVMNKAPGLGVVGALKQLGPGGLYLGAGARAVHVTSYIVAQFLIYDSIKRLCGIPVAGEQAGKKKAIPEGRVIKAT